MKLVKTILNEEGRKALLLMQDDHGELWLGNLIGDVVMLDDFMEQIQEIKESPAEEFKEVPENVGDDVIIGLDYLIGQINGIVHELSEKMA